VLMDFYRVTGNQKNEEKIVRFMLLCNLIVKREDGKDTFFEKTEDGKALHQLIKNRDYLGPLFESLGQTRLRFDDFKGLE